MRIVNLEQGTKEWLEWRRQGITATESSVILGLSPYKTVWRLWLEKLQKALPPDLSNNPLVRYGKETEAIARSLFEFEFGEVLFPTCAEYDENPVFRASFDWLTSDGSPFEFKCPGSWRRQGITATESSVILGLSPYKTVWRLWLEKLQKALPPDLSNNPLVRYGKETEAIARSLFEFEFGEVLFPTCAEYDENPVFRASFDGLTSEGSPVEFKCPGSSVLEEVKNLGLESEAAKHYSVQVQHQLLVSGSPKGWLVFFDGGTQKLLTFEIVRNDALIQDIVLRGEDFWNLNIKKGKEPAKDPVRDIYIPKKDEDVSKWCRLASDFNFANNRVLELQTEIDDLNKIRDKCKEELSEMMGDYRLADFAGVALTKRLTKGKVDYKSFLKSKNLSEKELDSFRGNQTESWLIRSTGDYLPKDFIDEELEAEIRSVKVSEPMWY